MKPLNEKQQKVLSFLQERAQDGLPPTVREICAAAGIKSTSTVHAYLKRWRRTGTSPASPALIGRSGCRERAWRGCRCSAR